jgi:hypothetical protein
MFVRLTGRRASSGRPTDWLVLRSISQPRFRHWEPHAPRSATDLSGNIETLPDAIRGACGPSNDHDASSNGYAHAADSPRPHLRPPRRQLLADRRSRRRRLRRPPRCVPPSFVRAHPPTGLSLPGPVKTTTKESDASCAPQKFGFLRLLAAFLAGRERDST